MDAILSSLRTKVNSRRQVDTGQAEPLECVPPRACIDVNAICESPVPGVVEVWLLPCPTPD